MRRILFGSLLIAIGALGGTAPAHAAVQPPVQAFGQLPMISLPAISPNGRYFAYLQDSGTKTVVGIYDLVGGGSPAGFSTGGALVTSLRWANDERLLVAVKMTQELRGDDRLRDWRRLISVNPKGQDAILVFDSQGPIITVGLTHIAGLAIDDRDHVYMPRWDYTNPHVQDTKLRKQEVAVLGLYRVSVLDDDHDFVKRGGEDTYRWFVDRAGNLVARIDRNRQLVDTIYSYGSGPTRVATLDMKDGAEASVAGLAADAKSLVLRTFRGSNTEGLYPMSLADGSYGSALFVHPKYDVMGAVYDEWTDSVVGATYADDYIRVHYFDAERQKLQKSLETTFPNRNAMIEASSVDGRKHIVRVDGPRHPPTFHLFDSATWRLDFLGAAYPNLEESMLGDMRKYDYKARDGLDIPAYLTLPPDRDAKNLPVVVLPHGGPEWRDMLEFDWWGQFLANRGYAVLQPNFRGSGGYGWKFRSAGFREWGGKMQDDVTDGVNKLVADGIADPARICIVGASYGGYAALAGAAFTPDLYACAVSVGGVSDLGNFIGHTVAETGNRSATVSAWEVLIGSRHSDKARLEAASPYMHADKVRAPVLLIHGANDTVVPIEQSEIMERAMVRAGKKVRLVRLEGDDHYLSLAASRIRVLTEIELFLRTHIGR